MSEERAECDEPQDLRALWQRWARRATDTQLAALVGVSVALIVAYAVLIVVDARAALHWWPAMVVPIVAGAFGTWSIADREQRDRAADSTYSGSRALAGLKVASAIAACLGAAAGVIGFLRLTVGTWIS